MCGLRLWLLAVQESEFLLVVTGGGFVGLPVAGAESMAYGVKGRGPSRNDVVAVGIALIVLAGLAWALYRPKVQQSKRYQATLLVTIGSKPLNRSS